MPAERITMRQAREIIRLKTASVSAHEISRRLGMPRSTVREALERAEGAGLSWPLPEGMNDDALEAALYANRRSKRGHRRVEEPDWANVHRELKRKHVTLTILWDEYIAENPGGYRYSRFCELYRAFEKTLSVTMRQTHAAGERLFVDYAGDGVPVVVDRLTGEVRMGQIFVAVLGASSLTFARASWTQTLPDWIDAHVGALEAIGGVPQLIVPDNAKTAIVKACFYDPQVNRTYADMAAHYGAALLPARPRKPRDKAKVESAVLIVERWLLGRLRRKTFYSLAEVNAAIDGMLKTLNEERPIRRLGVTRRQLFDEIDRPALKALPVEPYEYCEWRLRRVGIDYHVEIDAHYYSVPYRFARAEVEARLTVRGVEIFCKSERIAVHLRMSGNRKHTTIPEHMPSSHRRYAGWTVERIREDARKIGPATAALCEQILEARPHPEQGYRACLGIVRLVGPYGSERVEAAAERAIEIGAKTYGSVKSILDNKLDRKPAAKRAADAAPILHPNIRGPRYYH
ncbi:IS21 family transposase (plasmid) [Methylocystis rosea]|uniref:IS21 family transposase n=2 Tax=Methylocystis rosea TaxID=173366 RepID=A0A3G8MD43_9HYPH|nr:IS21 family transposase [Methylocystis rosea]AZG79100.1 IS21 family transposase [Methylocystis rosea]